MCVCIYMSRRAAADNPIQKVVVSLQPPQTHQSSNSNSLLSNDNVVAFAPGVLKGHVGLIKIVPEPYVPHVVPHVIHKPDTPRLLFPPKPHVHPEEHKPHKPHEPQVDPDDEVEPKKPGEPEPPKKYVAPGRRNPKADQNHSRLTYEEAKRCLEEEYTVHLDMKQRPYKPVTQLKDIQHGSQISIRAPGQGQIKLISGEIRFFEKHFDVMFPPEGSPSFEWTKEDKKTGQRHKHSYTSVVVYIGSAGGHHCSQYTQIYHDTLFVLVDKRSHHVGLHNPDFNNIHMIKEKWMGQRQVRRFLRDTEGPGPKILESGCPVLFVSDIRSDDTREMSLKSGDMSVERDQNTQVHVLEALRGQGANIIAYLLKYRGPFEFKEGDVCSRTAGELWLQSYAPHSSTELRIAGMCPTNKKEKVGTEEYQIGVTERILSHINVVLRVNQYWDAKGVAAVIAVMRENRKDWDEENKEKDQLRFQQTIAHVNHVPTREVERLVLASPTPSTLGSSCSNISCFM